MRTHSSIRSVVAATLVLALASAAAAQTQIATFVSVGGSVEVQRGKQGEWQAVSIAAPLFARDVVRTAPAGYAKLLFEDDVVTDLGPATEVAIEEYAVGRAKRSLLRLTQGKLEAQVGGYESDDARFEVETPTAVARVRGTDFVVSYDPAQKATEVVGIDGTVAVSGTTGIIGPGVEVGPNEMTHVPHDGFPSPVKTADDAQMRQALLGLRLIGTGLNDGLAVGNPVAEGRVVAASDRPAAATAGMAAGGSYLHPGVPGQTLLYELSPDNRANNQPLPDYRAVPPNQSPVPPH